ncbi:hypothetical protein ACFWVU_11140 [Streptomyces sp. NPDC058686]|uniref:hypothetical protein n=1 Tax=Streptomyces sp. NPDC058686 TaxID=3346599 RepID=UPI00364CCF99
MIKARSAKADRALIMSGSLAKQWPVAAINGEYSRGGFIAGWYLAIAGLILWAATVPEYSVPPTPRRARREEGA